MREIDLAVYADALAGESAAMSARAERIRSRLRQAKIGGTDERAAHAELRGLEESLAALEELQAWVEAELAATNAA